MGMMIRHNRLRKAQGATSVAPKSSPKEEVIAEKKDEKTADATVSKRGRKKAE